jgi:hypothetical protein
MKRGWRCRDSASFVAAVVDLLPMGTVELSSRAERDLRRMGPGVERDRIATALGDLGPGRSADLVALAGRPGWLRLRVGDWRVLLRSHRGGWWVERIVHRSALHQAVRAL